MRRISPWTAAAVLSTTPALAQTTPTWTVMSGIERFAFRDVVRTGPPVDASPVRWEGNGPTVVVARERTTPNRLRRIEVALSRAGGFSYASPLRSSAADGNDSALRLEGRYEYQRRMLTRRLPRFVEAAIGIRGSGARLALTHHVTPAFDIGMATNTAAASLALEGRFGRDHRVWGDVRYGNGAVLGWLQPHGAPNQSCGGWTTDLDAGISVRATGSLALTARYIDRGDTTLSSHRGFSTSNRRFTIGVRYAK